MPSVASQAGQGSAPPSQPDLSPNDLEKIRAAIRSKYTGVSVSAKDKFLYPTGKEGATALGYDPAVIEQAHPRLLESFCGVGNPFSLGKIKTGSRILDIGCGAGFDLFVASRLTGPNGTVCGIDLTAEMAERARQNLTRAGITNFEIKEVASETIPYPADFFDRVISNGVINLSPCKQELFKEIFRVLKPGGGLRFADVVLEGDLPEQMTGSLEAWSQ